jgi:carbohydrate binding protein with CBM11 domain
LPTPGRRRSVFVLLLAGAVLAALALRVALWRPRPVQGAPPDDGFTRVGGIVHVHTTLSDGGGMPEEVAAAAKKAGLRFVVLTDHNNLDAKPFEGEHDGVLVLVGTEISTTAGHVLGLGIPDPVFRFSGDGQDALDDVRDLGGAAFAAHPLSPREDFRWTGWELPGPWGIELVNGDSQWRAAGWPRLLRTAALYGLSSRYALLGSLTPPDETLGRWDAMLARRDVAGIAGADAHARLVVRKNQAVRFPSYESLFGLVQDHVVLDRPLSGQAGPDGQAILAALAKGRCYVGLDALAPAGEFSFTAEAAGRRFTMGDTVAPEPGLELRAGGRMPAGSRVTIRRDGAVAAEGESSVEVSAAEPGVYRAEVRVPGWSAPWILSNPIYVFGPDAAAERQARAAWPPQPPAPAPVMVIDRFEGATRFEPGSDDRSTVGRPILDPQGGADGRGAARFAFHLGIPTPEHPHVFGALVDWTHRDLTGRRGLVFSIKGDGVYRIWVQVRDDNPASKDEGTEWWFASVRTSAEWQRVAVPFERLRSINPNSDGRLDLDKVRAIVFVLDKGADKPGTQGTIWLDDLGVY